MVKKLIQECVSVCVGHDGVVYVEWPASSVEEAKRAERGLS